MRRVSAAGDPSGRHLQGQGYGDYRKLLERKDIDAVLIATPDHWHGKIAIEAMEEGKHVYVEKPMTHTVAQAIAVRDTVRRLKKVLQVGPQGTGNDGYWQAHEAIKAGRIGKVTWAQGCYNRNARVCLFNAHQKIDPTAGPDKPGEDRIDWDMWLGHEWGLAPKIPWTPDHYFRFRKYWPYNGGVATDLLYHKLAPLLIAIAGPNGEYPLRVNACGGLYIEKDGRDIPDTFLMTADYPSEFSVFWSVRSRTMRGSPIGFTANTARWSWEATRPSRPTGSSARNSRRKMTARPTFASPVTSGGHDGQLPRRHPHGGTLHCNAELGAATMVAIKLAVESYRQRKTMTWDAKNERVVC